MGVLDDLEAARQGWIDNPGASEARDYFTNLAFKRLPALLAVCRAAVAYREAEMAFARYDPNDSIAEDNRKYAVLKSTKQALLAATEGLT